MVYFFSITIYKEISFAHCSAKSSTNKIPPSQANVGSSSVIDRGLVAPGVPPPPPLLLLGALGAGAALLAALLLLTVVSCYRGSRKSSSGYSK